MNVNIFSQVGRFLLLFALQAFVFKQISFGWGDKDYFYIFLYPLFILLLPMNLPNSLNILFSFALGLSIDFFYETLGLHAAAATFTAFMRPLVIFRLLRPREGYKVKDQPTKELLGNTWFLRYGAIMLFLHLFFFFSVQAFTFVYWLDIVMKTILSFIGSYVFIMAGVYVFRPKV